MTQRILVKTTDEGLDQLDLSAHVSDVGLYRYDDEGAKISTLVDAARPLPSPTRDVECMKADLNTHGYCMVADALRPEQISQLRMRTIQQHAGECAVQKMIVTANGEIRLSNLLNKGDEYQQVVAQPLTDVAVEHLLGESFLLSMLMAVQTVPGARAQGLHVDQLYIGFKTPVAMACNAVWMLDDFTEANGATRIIPGSHLWPREKIEQKNFGLRPTGEFGLDNPPETIAAVAPAGTCMVFDGRLLHGTGRNFTADETRLGIFAYYVRPFIRPVENAFLSIDDDVMMKLPIEVRMQLGYRPWMGCGGFEASGNPPPIDVVRPLFRTGRLGG